MDTLSALNLLTSILGFIVAGILVFSPSQNRLVNRFLGVAFFSMAYRSLSIFAVEQHLIGNNFLMGSISFIYYFTQPAIFLYFRSMIRDEQSLRRSDWKHLVVPGAAVLLLVYYLIMGLIYYGAFRLPSDQTVFNEIREYPLFVLPKYHAFALLGVCIFYLLWSWKLVIQKLGRKKGEHPQFTKMRNWILTLQITFTSLLAILLYQTIIVLVLKVKVNFVVNPDMFRCCVLLFLFTRILVKPDLLLGIPRINTSLPVIDEIKEKEIKPAPLVHINEVAPENIVYEEAVVPTHAVEVHETIEQEQDANLYFDAYGWVHFEAEHEEMSRNLNSESAPIEKDKVISYIQRINTYLGTGPYTRQDFDMKMISTDLDCPLYHIEYLFRYYNMYTFSEFRNVLRVQFVLKDFEKGVHHDYTMEGVGLKAGFNSRSSFFRVFKTVTGTTPKQFLGTQDPDSEEV